MSAEALVYPDTMQILTDILDGATYGTDTILVVWHLPAGAYGQLAGPFPMLHILPPRGTEGAFDKVDRFTLELYVEGRRASPLLEAIKATIVGTDLESPAGYIDTVTVVTSPEDVPYQSDTLNLARATFDVISRPV